MNEQRMAVDLAFESGRYQAVDQITFYDWDVHIAQNCSCKLKALLGAIGLGEVCDPIYVQRIWCIYS